MKIATVVATSLIVGSVTASKSTKVGVTCKNLDVNALSPKALAYAAKAVEMTYDAVNKQEGAHAVAVGTFATDSSLRSKSAGLAFSVRGVQQHCRLCRKDDDAKLGEPVLLADWESELTAVLSKAPYPALSGVQSCSIDFAFEDTIASSKSVLESPGSGMPVTVDVKCVGLDFSDLSAPALAAATKALKASYNAVHSVEGDGRSLEGIQIDGPRVYSNFEAFVKQHCRLCRKDDDTTIADEIVQDIAASVGQHCRLCRKDDDEELAEHNMVFTAYNVGQHCRLCRKDDDAERNVLVEENDLAAWQDLFVAGLHSDASSAFNGVQQCVITMSEAGRAIEVF